MLAGERLRLIDGRGLTGDVTGGEHRVRTLRHTGGGAQLPLAEGAMHKRGPGVSGETVEEARVHRVTVAEPGASPTC